MLRVRVSSKNANTVRSGCHRRLPSGNKRCIAKSRVGFFMSMGQGMPANGACRTLAAMAGSIPPFSGYPLIAIVCPASAERAKRRPDVGELRCSLFSDRAPSERSGDVDRLLRSKRGQRFVSPPRNAITNLQSDNPDERIGITGAVMAVIVLTASPSPMHSSPWTCPTGCRDTRKPLKTANRDPASWGFISAPYRRPKPITGSDRSSHATSPTQRDC